MVPIIIQREINQLRDINMELYIKTFGKLFRVRCLASSIAEANEYMEAHENCGFLHEENGIYIIADNNETKI